MKNKEPKIKDVLRFIIAQNELIINHFKIKQPWLTQEDAKENHEEKEKNTTQSVEAE